MKISFLLSISVLLFIGCASTVSSQKDAIDTQSSSVTCDSGLSCHNIGLVSAGRGDYKSAARYFEKACSYGISEACNNLAFQYANAEGVKQSYTLAYRYWGMACRMGNSSACSNLQLAKDKVEQMRRARR